MTVFFHSAYLFKAHPCYSRYKYFISFHYQVTLNGNVLFILVGTALKKKKAFRKTFSSTHLPPNLPFTCACIRIAPSVCEHVFQRLNEVPYSNPKSTPPSHLCKNINLANISSLLHQKFPLSGCSSNNMLEFCPSFRNKNKKTSLTVDLPSALIPILMFPHTAHLLRVRRPQSLYPLPHLSFSPIHILIQAFEPITPIKPHFPKPPRSFPFAKSSGKSQRSSDQWPLPVAVSLLPGNFPQSASRVPASPVSQLPGCAFEGGTVQDRGQKHRSWHEGTLNSRHCHMEL